MTTINTKIVDEKYINTQDATSLLKADHTLISLLFSQYSEAKSATKKKTLVVQLCSELQINTRIKEEIFYPSVKKILANNELISKAIAGHVTIRELIVQIENFEPDGEAYDAKVTTLCNYAAHCFKEEENTIFPKVESSKLNLLLLGEKLSTRKEQLHAEQEILLL